MQGIFCCKKPGKSGVSHLGQSVVGIQETKKVRGIGRKMWEGSWMSKAAWPSSYLALQRKAGAAGIGFGQPINIC